MAEPAGPTTGATELLFGGLALRGDHGYNRRSMGSSGFACVTTLTDNWPYPTCI